VKFISTLVIVGVLVSTLLLWDASERYENDIFCPTPKEIKAFNTGNPKDSLKNVYQAHFFDQRFSFPRQAVNTIKITKNKPLIGRFFTNSLNKFQCHKLLEFLNNPDNFTWQKVTMLRSDADYIIYFYNDKKKVIGKVWFCTSCSQLIAVPFSPNMKFGTLKILKTKELTKLSK